MLVTFVVIISAVLLSGVSSSSSDKCQLGCDNLNLSYPPIRCMTLYNDVQRTLQQFSSIRSTDVVSCSRATLRALLEIFCTRECLSTFPTYQTCVNIANGEQVANLTLTGFCTRHADGTFCPLKIIEETTGPDNAFVLSCASGGSCDSDCQASYRNASGRLGCCGSSWYENPVFSASSSPNPSDIGRLFANCNVTLNGPCEAATATTAAATATTATASPSMSGATTMVYLSSVLVVAIACLLSLTSVV